MTTVRELWLGFGVLFTVFLITLLIGTTQLANLQKNLNDLVATTTAASETASRIDLKMLVEKELPNILTMLLLALLATVVIGMGVVGLVGRGIVKAEKALQGSEERFRRMANTVPALIWTAAPDGTITFASDRWYAYTGLTPEQNRHHWQQLVLHPDDYKRCVQQWATALRDGSEYEIEVRNRRWDGEYRWWMTRATPIRDGEGRILEWFGSCTDIDAQKQAETRLRESEELFRRLVFAIPAAVYTTDCQGRVTLFNDQAAELWGRRPELGKDLWCGSLRMFRPDGTPLAHDECPMAITLREDRAVRGHEILLERPDGKRICVLPHPELLRDASGEIIGAVNMLVDITDRKQAEEKLRESEERFRSLLQAITSVVWTANAEGRFVTPQPSWSEYTGQTWDEYRDFGWTKAIHTDDRARIQSQWEAACKAKTLFHAEGRFWHAASSAYHHFEARGVPILSGDGSVREWVGKCLDVEPRWQAERKQRENEERLRQALAAARAGAWEYDLLTGTAKWSPEMYALYGIDPAASAPSLDQFASLLHPEDRERAIAEIQATAQHGGTCTIEFRVLRPDGTEWWATSNGLVELGPDGRAIRARGIDQDITARKRAEEKLRESGEWLHQLADAMPQVVWSAQPNGAFDYRNQRWYELMGMAEEEDQDWNWEPLLHADDLPRWREGWSQAVQLGKQLQVECRFKDRETGAYRWYLCRALPVRDRNQQIIRWYGTCTDIDQQKHTEETLMIADRRKDEFLAVLSHELRNPLAPIRNALQILRLGNLEEEEMVEAREVIERQVHQLAGIVDDLLDVFRIANQKMLLNKETLDLTQLVRQSVEDYRSVLEGNHLNLSVETGDKPIWVQGDHRRLSQVVINLLSNAGKYSNPGDEIVVRIEADTRNHQAQITVRDTGIGISPDLLPHIFETFIQEEQSADRRRGGLGLGLPLVKGIVELHGGRVEAESEGSGHGTTMRIWLPLVAKPRATPRERSHIVTPARRLRILIIEDNVDTARTLALLLQWHGHEVMTAHTGPLGLQKAQEWRPEIILCDIGLPEMDGYAVARAVRGEPATAHVRLIAVSGYGQEDDRRRSEEAGFDLHLTKPVDPVELQRLLAVIKIGA